ATGSGGGAPAARASRCRISERMSISGNLRDWRGGGPLGYAGNGPPRERAGSAVPSARSLRRMPEGVVNRATTGGGGGGRGGPARRRGKCTGGPAAGRIGRPLPGASGEFADGVLNVDFFWASRKG